MALPKDIEETLLQLCKEIIDGEVECEVTFEPEIRQYCEGYNLILYFLFNRNCNQFVFEVKGDGLDENIDIFVNGDVVKWDDFVKHRDEYIAGGSTLYNRWLDYMEHPMVMTL